MIWPVVEPGLLEIVEVLRHPVEVVTALAVVAVVVAQVFAEEQRLVVPVVPVGLVPHQLVDKVLHFVPVLHRRPADPDLGQQVHVAAAGAVVGLTPDVVTIVVPGAIESTQVEFGGDVFRLVLLLPARCRTAGIPVAPPEGDDVCVTAKEHVFDPPVEVGVTDVLSQFVCIIHPVVGRVYIVDIRCLHPQAAGFLLLDQRLEGGEQSFGGDQQVVVPRLSAQAPLTRRLGIETEGRRVVHKGRHLDRAVPDTEHGQAIRIADLWSDGQFQTQFRLEQEPAALRPVLHGEETNDGDVIPVPALDRNQLGPLGRIELVRTVDGCQRPVGSRGAGQRIRG